jgi:NTE family protein
VQINPRERSDPPRSATEILNRLNEISFNSPLMKELRMIALLRQVADPGIGEGARCARMRTHRIRNERLSEFGASSKLNAECEFILMLTEEVIAAPMNSLAPTVMNSAGIPLLISTC